MPVALNLDLDRLQASVRSAIDLNTRFYSSLLDLSTQYLRALGGIVAGAAPGPQAGSAAARAAAPPTPPLLLAARAGEQARAAFIVENTLPHAVSARVVPSGLGTAVRIAVEPETVNLEPGAQCVVQVSAAIGPELATDRDYPGELAIPELASRAVPFVVRRLADAPAGSHG
ncbi:MAG: hypothetical protein IRY94_03380 [Rhodospirillaceae bacterium]|nr:hypothetical protein [Rhodospirillaceae bacterium]